MQDLKMNKSCTEILPGVWKFTLGTPEEHTPVKLRNILPNKSGFEVNNLNSQINISLEDINCRQTSRGIVVDMPLEENEDIYGFGLQLKSHCQTGKKKVIRVNSDPVSDTGDSHAPVPFYLSTAGYGVLVDTARYASFYCGSHQRISSNDVIAVNDNKEIGTNTDDLYSDKKNTNAMTIDIPTAKGVDVYVFSGSSMKDALSKYIMFSGGGCLPPLWGLGMIYRGYAPNSQEDTLNLAKQFRDNKMPCDVFGLEPGWMDKSYSCNYIWNKDKFAQKDEFLKDMQSMGFEINLWEQFYVEKSAPFFKDIKKYCGDHTVFGGLVPDFSLAEAKNIFAKYHRENFIDAGIHGFKLDECDNSDYIRFPWAFPEYAEFPSGIDGEQMHSFLGVLGQEAILQSFREANKRTYSNCRSSHALSAPYPVAIYSDLYKHEDFIRGTVNAGLSGLLWTPEVRQCESVEELIRRIQSVVFSPMALVNAWMVKNPPWHQYDEEKNNRDELLDNHQDVEASCRELFELRMSFIPYIYTSFANYYLKGEPVFRALVVDWPNDLEVRNIENQYMVGDNLMFAPLIAGQTEREVYLPEGEWINFFTEKKYSGKQKYIFKAGVKDMLLFVKNNTLLPIAEPLTNIKQDTCFKINVKVYGDNPSVFKLFCDDGYSYDFEKEQYDWLQMSWDNQVGGQFKFDKNLDMKIKYSINDWVKVC